MLSHLAAEVPTFQMRLEIKRKRKEPEIRGSKKTPRKESFIVHTG